MKAETANAEQAKILTMLVIRARDMRSEAVSVRLRGNGDVIGVLRWL